MKGQDEDWFPRLWSSSSLFSKVKLGGSENSVHSANHRTQHEAYRRVTVLEALVATAEVTLPWTMSRVALYIMLQFKKWCKASGGKYNYPLLQMKEWLEKAGISTQGYFYKIADMGHQVPKVANVSLFISLSLYFKYQCFPTNVGADTHLPVDNCHSVCYYTETINSGRLGSYTEQGYCEIFSS